MLSRVLREFKCKTCGKDFLWNWKQYGDFRCRDCRNKYTVAEVEREMAEMPEEEYQSFLDDIEEFEKDK